ncbi:hypothetical protein C6503_03455 [Candidatus Poribacteria bacterium]|nr:MAG: hypothetical protein C6503_03455 [Candidatus Poribacteria bacterium]
MSSLHGLDLRCAMHPLILPLLPPKNRTSEKENFTMKHLMKATLTFLILLDLVLLNTFAQDIPYTKLGEHRWRVHSVSFSPDGKTLASGGMDDTIKLWDVNTKGLRHTFKGHMANVYSVSFSPDGKTLASGHQDSTILLWDVNTRGLRHAFEGSGVIYSLSFSPDGKTLASGDSGGDIRLWDVNTGELRHTREGHWKVYSVSFSPDGKTLASGGADATIKLWDVNTGEFHTFFEGGLWNKVRSVSFSPDGKTLASGSADATIRLWNVNGLRHTLKVSLTGWMNVYSVSFSPDGETLASGSVDNTIRLWDVNTGKLRHTLEGHWGAVYSVSFSPDGKTLASGGMDRAVLLWELSPVAVSPADPVVEMADVMADVDVNEDGSVNILDLEMVDSLLGTIGQSRADVNSDGVVNIADLVLVASAIGPAGAAAPAIHNRLTERITAEKIQRWLTEARLLGETSSDYQRGILMLEQLLAVLTPKTTALLPNYPNPFNPETWIPYQLEKPAEVTVTIYAANGTPVRTLEVGHQPAGIYKSRARAAHWDGKNELSEPVASGLYLYTLTAGEFTATRRMLIRQ